MGKKKYIIRNVSENIYLMLFMDGSSDKILILLNKLLPSYCRYCNIYDICDNGEELTKICHGSKNDPVMHSTFYTIRSLKLSLFLLRIAKKWINDGKELSM